MMKSALILVLVFALCTGALSNRCYDCKGYNCKTGECSLNGGICTKTVYRDGSEERGCISQARNPNTCLTGGDAEYVVRGATTVCICNNQDFCNGAFSHIVKSKFQLLAIFGGIGLLTVLIQNLY